MFAARDQENLIHGHQTVAAAKPLNQGVRGLAPKTPGNNGQKAALNAKSVLQTRGKDAENTVFGGNKGKGTEKPVLLTPAPRDRAPLGAKTTNAKAHAYQTPGPLTGGQGLKTQKRSSTRKPKLKVHHQVDQGQVLEIDNADDEPEIEYCPPKITELPDFPSDDELYIEEGQKLPQFDTTTFLRDWYEHSGNQRGSDGLTRWQRREKELKEQEEKDFEEMRRKGEELFVRLAEEDISDVDEAKKTTQTKPATHKRSISTVIKKPSTTKDGPSTVKSRAAVNALSHTSKPNFAAPTSSTQARYRASNPSVDGHATMGYAKGRRVASTLKDQAPQIGTQTSRSNQSKQSHSQSAGRKSLEEIVQPPNESEEIMFALSSRPAWMDESEDEEVFQLPMPKP